MKNINLAQEGEQRKRAAAGGGSGGGRAFDGI